MIKIVAIGFLVLFTTSCINETENNITSLDDAFQKLAPEVQKFQIDPIRDTVVEGTHGTRIFIPKNSLEFANGNAPKNMVDIELKEYNSTSEMLGDNLTTLIHQLNIATAGMVYLSATSDGKKIHVKPNKEIGIYFPEIGNRNEHMGLLQAGKDSNGEFTWEFTGDTGIVHTQKIDTIIIERQKNGIRISGFSTGSSSGLLNSEGQRTWDITSWKFLNSTQDIFTFSENYFDTVAISNHVCKTCADIEVEVEIHNNGKATLKKYISKAPKVCRGYINTFIDALPAFDLNYMGSKGQSYYTLKFSFSDNINRRKFNAAFRQKYQTLGNNAAEEKNMHYCAYYLKKFGWVTLDNTLFPGDIVNFYVRDTGYNTQKVIVIYEEEWGHSSAIVKNQIAFFHRIPYYRPIIVIGVSYRDGKLYRSIARTLATKKYFDLPEPEEVSLDQLREEIDAFDGFKRGYLLK